ncbi:MAG: hypothetical protein HY423_01080 [Candidatus Lambdaproteobacteria bacterium]|nr:hypothetical protein [Candidatus Lambdaproteobacteria bacterium]
MLNEKLVAERLTFQDFEEVNEAYHARQWTDGLPIIPPTLERVQAMIAASGRAAGDTVAVVPPRWAEASIENVAINAVMAGCLPEHMPVLVAALEAACDPAFALYSVQATTHPCAVLMVVTGPITERLKLNHLHGVYGPGFRANASLGRAMRLVLLNVGGGIPAKGDQSTQGSPAKFSYCIAENEPGTPWEPFRVALGFGKGDSTVTVFSGEAPHNVNDHVCTSAYTVLKVIASTMSTLAHNHVTAVKMGDTLVVLGPEHAHTIAAGGLSRRDAQQFLFDHARNPAKTIHDGGPNRQENWPKWVPRGDPEAMIPIVARPEDIHILVAGGPGKHSSFVPCFGFSKSVTRRIETAAT